MGYNTNTLKIHPNEMVTLKKIISFQKFSMYVVQIKTQLFDISLWENILKLCVLKMEEILYN